jgi:hypothetical protein
MASSFSHEQILSKLPQPGAKLGESDLDSGIRLEAGASFSASPQSKQPFYPKGLTEKLFVNGWFCEKCDCTTEHKKINGQEICVKCGSFLGYKKNNSTHNQKKHYLKNYRHINIKNWSPEQAAEFSKTILQQFKEQGE